MIVFRLCKAKYASDLTGKGAEKSGGRWNSKGNALIYTSGSRALCTTEIAVHTPLGNIPLDYCIVSLEVPNDIPILETNSSSLPDDWRSFPHPHSTQQIGDQFISENKFLVLKVPSVIVPGEYNFLINPNHKDINGVKILSTDPFNFDERLFKK